MRFGHLLIGLDCEITQGDGGIGTVRVLNGTIVEPMVAQTKLSYGYTQPVVEGQYYTLYHGFMEARPVSESTSELIYTMMWDTSQVSRWRPTLGASFPGTAS